MSFNWLRNIFGSPVQPEGANGIVTPIMADHIRQVVKRYGLPEVKILSAQEAYSGFVNPQTGLSTWKSGLVQFPDGRTIMVSEFFESPTNNVDARMRMYKSFYPSDEE